MNFSFLLIYFACTVGLMCCIYTYRLNPGKKIQMLIKLISISFRCNGLAEHYTATLLEGTHCKVASVRVNGNFYYLTNSRMQSSAPERILAARMIIRTTFTLFTSFIFFLHFLISLWWVLNRRQVNCIKVCARLFHNQIVLVRRACFVHVHCCMICLNSIVQLR